MEITFLGGATTVTGSPFLITTDRARVLVDCGMFQGSPNESIRNRVPFGFDPATLDAVLLTHAHLDHCGRLPLLVKEGYGGTIHATAGTCELASLVLLDSGHLHEEFAKREARWEQRHPDEVEADDRKQEAAYQAAIDLAAAGGSGGGRRRDGRLAPAGAAASATAASARPSPANTSRRPSSPSRRTTGRRAIPRPSCAASPRSSRSTSMRRCIRSRTPNERSNTSARSTTTRSGKSRRASGRRSSMPDTSSARRSSGCAYRTAGRSDVIVCSGDLGRPGHPDHPRPDVPDRRRLRPRRVDLRRPRARAPGRGDPDPRRDGPARRRCGRRAARAVVRDRPDAGGRLGARPPDRAGRDPAAAAVPRLADGDQGVRHLPPLQRLLRRGDRASCCTKVRPPLDYPSQIVINTAEGVAGDPVRASGRT